MNDQKFNAFIIGAQKAATSSLHFMLMEHPEVATLRAELPIFQYDYDSDEMKTLISRHNRSGESRRVLLLKRPDLLCDLKSIERIHEHNPEAKFICVLRNPVERAVSAALYAMKRGKIQVMSVDDALESSMDQNREKSVDEARLCEYGLYGKYLKEWLGSFPSNNFLFLLNEEMQDAPSVMARVCDFLGIQKLDSYEGLSRSKQKSGIRSLFRLRLHSLISLLVRQRDPKTGLTHLRSPRFIFSVVDVMFRYFDDWCLRHLFSSDSSCQLSDESRSRLYHYYANDLNNLTALLDLDLSAWRRK